MSGFAGLGRRAAHLELVDSMPPSLRACVHEFGSPIVDACLQAKVSDPRRIRHLVHVIWEGARQQGQRTSNLHTLDWLLIQAGAEMSASALLRLLESKSYALVPNSPTRAMLDASLAEVSGHNVRVTKEEKHRRRLRAALMAGMREQTKSASE